MRRMGRNQEKWKWKPNKGIIINTITISIYQISG